MKTGQTMIGGVAVNAERNAFGRQVESYETQLDLYDIQEEPALRYTNEVPMVFIRAPCITKVLSDKCKVLATLPKSGHKRDGEVVAVRQGHLLATSFHPELTPDISWHQYFLDIVRHYQK
jgi:5'-phosphate synthase pdxT subunit